MTIRRRILLVFVIVQFPEPGMILLQVIENRLHKKLQIIDFIIPDKLVDQHAVGKGKRLL